MVLKKTVSKHSVLYCPFVNNEKELEVNSPFGELTLGFLGKSKEPHWVKTKILEQMEKSYTLGTGLSTSSKVMFPDNCGNSSLASKRFSDF